MPNPTINHIHEAHAKYDCRFQRLSTEVKGVVTTINVAGLLAASEIALPGSLAAIGITPVLPALAAMTVAGIAISKSFAYLSEQQCLAIAERMNEVAAQQNNTEQALQP